MSEEAKEKIYEQEFWIQFRDKLQAIPSNGGSMAFEFDPLIDTKDDLTGKIGKDELDKVTKGSDLLVIKQCVI